LLLCHPYMQLMPLLLAFPCLGSVPSLKHIDCSCFCSTMKYGVQHCESDNDTWQPEFLSFPPVPLAAPVRSAPCFLVDDEPSAEVARRFGYSPAPSASSAISSATIPETRPSSASHNATSISPARDRVRDLAVAMRKRNLSVYDMQRELAAAGHTISVNSLTVLLREEGFARLPAR